MGLYTPPFPFGYAMPEAAFDDLISWAGINMIYMQGHSCPCIGDTGSPNPSCIVCFNRGVYWDPPLGPFIVLITYISWLGRNVAIGDNMDPTYGMSFEAHPILTIQNVPENQVIYQQTNTNDIFIEPQAVMRFQATLRVGENMTVPAWQIAGGSLTEFNIPETGAVVVEDPTINQPVEVASYTVSGGTVTLNPNGTYPNGYPKGTAYTVDYYSQPLFVIQEKFGGLMHARPFGQGINYPHRYKLNMIDMWLRQKIGSSTNIQPAPGPAPAPNWDVVGPDIDVIGPDIDTQPILFGKGHKRHGK